ncbi:MAG: ribosome silencing factor [Halorhodospira halophila]|uniref:ribosome silencing factor n=1 Tax=Halorhodospira TaxID=85108 RepID=UPI0019121B75|nr:MULTISPECIES: ribosome silencing factor [Halorhodospira]MBK5936690.1 ribosome silencing factor [Halorhodospira halophila]MBK5944454.1 ribosome silencing factor [Halorhodospira halophila]MCC3750581.1 ribosome silencing factor [Halorhodospira halophila]MCG5527425.1 ribosome silencing factor [Halorhodospira halophila]MCG5532855.1 ribosome silencing factor [Halorhodospira sp. 9621]
MVVEELEQRIRESLDGIKALDTVAIDVRGRTPVTDLIVVTTGTSRRHVHAVARSLVDDAKASGLTPLGVEGDEPNSEWVLIDLGDAVVHVMTRESRDFYRLERMWEMDEACASTSSQ